jgi:hypothetical protein
MTTPASIDPKDIRAHWAKYQGDRYVDGWASLWDSDNLPWDRGFPNPALEDTLIQRAGTIGEPIAQDGQRRKALVPGCGRGVDVLLLASFGYDAYGLEVSATAVDACKKEEKENHSWYRVRDEKAGKGKVTFVQGDFFDDAWLKEIGVPRNGFDIIYDYTVCILAATVGLHSVITIIFSPLVSAFYWGDYKMPFSLSLDCRGAIPDLAWISLVFLVTPFNSHIVFLCSGPRAPA